MKRFNIRLFVLTLAYIVATSTIIAASLALLIYPFNPSWCMYIPLFPIGVLAASTTAFTWTTELTLLKENARLPLPEEEARLLSGIRQIQSIQGGNRRYRLLIIETGELDAFATGSSTIAISAGMLSQLTQDELEGVIAHEMAHLLAGDTIFTSAAQVATWISDALLQFSRLVWKILRPLLVIWFVASQFLIILAYLVYDFNAWILLAGIGVPLVVLPPCARLFHFLFLAQNRYAEYRRDRYAKQLGYGPALSSALRKIGLSLGPQPVSRHFIYFRSSHPVLQHRIRRLESSKES